MIDVEADQILGLEDANELVHNDSLFTPLLEQAESLCGSKYHLHRGLGDDSYDRTHVFNTIEQGKIVSDSRPGMTLR